MDVKHKIFERTLVYYDVDYLFITDVVIFNPSPSSISHLMPVLMCLCAGAACQGFKDGFRYSVVNPQLGKVTVYSAKCT